MRKQNSISLYNSTNTLILIIELKRLFERVVRLTLGCRKGGSGFLSYTHRRKPEYFKEATLEGVPAHPISISERAPGPAEVHLCICINMQMEAWS